MVFDSERPCVRAAAGCEQRCRGKALWLWASGVGIHFTGRTLSAQGWSSAGMLLDNDSFLTDLTKMYLKNKSSGTVWVTMKRSKTPPRMPSRRCLPYSSPRCFCGLLWVGEWTAATRV